jgi:hypothetical protein
MAKAKRFGRLIAVLMGLAICWFILDQVDATVGKRVKGASLKGTVTDSRSRPVVGATVYLIDAAAINTTPITPADILSGVSEAYDEPLEDIVNDATKEPNLPKAVTDSLGRFKMKVPANAFYYAFVKPAAEDVDHLPGGDASRDAFSPKAISKSGLNIKVSWKVPSDATYIGSSACYVCHSAGSAADATNCKKHAHALMLMRPGQPTANQSLANHGAWTEFANKFTLATDYNKPVAPATSVETLYFQDYNSSSATNNGNAFVLYENTPKAGSTIYLKAYLWKNAANEYKVTLENVITPTDPNNFLTLDVPAVMGGYLRQRLLVKYPPSLGLKGLYTFISYQAFTGTASKGNMNNYDRSRKPFLMSGSGGGGLATFFNATTKLLVIPVAGTPPRTLQACASCHIGAGAYKSFTDGVTAETLASTVADVNGVCDIDADGSTDDVGIGCEQCHGPGSRHRDEAIKGVYTTGAGRKAQTVDNSAKYIVNPKLLGHDRASLICGRCHAEINHISSNNFAPPGISRAEFLGTYASNTGSALTRFWADGHHELGGHRGTAYSDWLDSKHMRNSRRLVACDDCHDSMGNSSDRYFLKGDPDDPNSELCMRCHAVDVVEHVPEMTGSVMTGSSMACRQCHMPRIGKGGAGRPGLILGTPTGASTDESIVYWENDQASHIMEPYTKFTRAVSGVVPGKAMPAPYTNSCGTCHDASKLQYQGSN